MTIIATSDLHGNLPEINDSFDLLLICGDICPAYDHSVEFQSGWCDTVLSRWFNDLPYRDEYSRVIMTWGNHDFVGEKQTYAMRELLQQRTNGRVIVLTHDICTWQHPEIGTNLKIFGTPYCGLFGTWAFMKDDETLDRLFGQIPEGIDILLSHDSPNIWKLGAILEGKWKSDFTGNRVLPKHLERIKPRFLFTGHFHSGNHDFGQRDGIWCANVSFVDEHYIPSNLLLKVNIENGVVASQNIYANCIEWQNWLNNIL